MCSPDRRKHHRLQRALAPLLQQIEARFNTRILFESDRDIETRILPALNNLYLRYLPRHCLQCNQTNHPAWIKLRCGKCEKIYWVAQCALSRGYWCLACSFAWQRASPQRALVDLIRAPFLEAIQRIENREDLELRWLVWRVRHAIERVIADSNTVVLATICGDGIRVPTMWQVSPHQWDNTCRRFARPHERRHRHHNK